MLVDFTGQPKLVESLKISVAAAKHRGDPLDHILCVGQPGLGKTSLANILANEMGSKIIVVNAPSIKTKGELAGVLTRLEEGDILFIDEIHRLSPVVEEILYPVMEDFKLEVIVGKGVNAEAVVMKLPSFTLIGATTLAGMLTKPLLDRFGEICEFEPYSAEDLSSIVLRSAKLMGLEFDSVAANVLAHRSKGTPRIANRILRRVRDHVQFNKSNFVDVNAVKATCDRLGIDHLGLDKTSRKLLSVLVEKARPIGLDLLASTLGESKATIEEICEPYLIRNGFIERTTQGRIATKKAKDYVKV
jgi:Holliday junction DNA helicase RuvB